jgi:uncharacterized phage protein gp47/JayE
VAISPIFPGETTEDIYLRLLEDLPPPAGGGSWNTRAGSLIHAVLMPIAVEIQRLHSYSEDALTMGFLLYAIGNALDDKAAEFGLTRRPATQSTATLLVTGDEGAVINNGSRFSTQGDFAVGSSGVEFEVINGPYTIAPSQTTVLVEARSVDPGAHTNVDPDTIVLIVDPLPGITDVNNPDAAEGGTDVEDDEELRFRALTRAGQLPASGNKATYVALGLNNIAVGGVRVEDLWLGNGTARVVLSGRDTIHVAPSVVDEIQADFDPSVLTLAHFEAAEAWSGASVTTEVNNPLEGEESRILATAGASQTVTTTLTKTLNLGFWDDAADEIHLSVKVAQTGRVSNLKVAFIDPGGTGVGLTEATITGATIDGLGGGTGQGRLEIARSSFTTTGTFSWSSIGSIRISLTSTASGAASITLDGLRIYSTAGGHGEGQAPIGIQVTVISAKATKVDAEASIYVDAGLMLSDIQDDLKKAIADAIRNLPIGEGVIRLSYIANVIHDFPGVVDYANVKLARTGQALTAANLTLAEGERPLAGTITLTAGS